MNTTITIEKLADTITDKFEIIYFLIDHIHNLGESSDNLRMKKKYSHTDLDPFDFIDNTPLLKEVLTEFFRNTEINSDAKVLSELLKLYADTTKVSDVLYSTNLNDDDVFHIVADLFHPLIHDKIKEYVDVALTTPNPADLSTAEDAFMSDIMRSVSIESKAKRLSVLDIYKQYNEAA